ncbi:hypothetical protein PENSPDRAFT_687217 [Peniophora sp. CONT]|nr:hypothetical protein PENSPDRAFT_687217 [Peniophora sp. CONT]
MKNESHSSVAFVISQMQPRPPLPAHVAPRRTRSSPMLRKQRREAMVPFFPPTLEQDFLTMLDIKPSDLSRRSSEATIELPPRSSSRSSCALSAEVLDDDCSFEIVVEPPSPTVSYASSKFTSSSGSSTLVSTPSVRRRKRAKAVIHGALDAVFFRWCGVPHSVRHEENLTFDLCT